MHTENLRILIVEDDYETAKLFSMLLAQKFSAEIERAESCSQARERLSSATYNLITLDHQLPDGEGLDLLREITIEKDHPPIVMVTGHGDEKTAVEAFKAGVSGYVVKDNRLSVILPETIKRALSEVALKQAEEEILRLADEVKQQAKMLDEILSSSPDHIYLHDWSGKYMYVNNAAAKSFGLEIKDVIGKTWEELEFSPQFMNAFDSRKEAVFKTGLPVTGETFFMTVAGLRNYEYILAPVHDDSGGIKYVLSTFRDVTERTRAEEAVREQRDRAQHYLDIAEVILLALDRDGTVSLINRKGCELLGYTEEEILGKNWFDSFVPEARKAESKQVFEIMMLPRHDIAEYYEAEVLTKQGTTRTIAWRCSLLMDNQGKAVGTLGSGNDITEKKLSERSLKESEETFRIAAETATDLIYIWHVASDQLEWFGDIDGVLGYRPGEFPRTIKGWLDAVHSDDYMRVVDALDRLVLSGEPFAEEYRVQMKDGSYRYWINRSRALTNEKGVPVKIVGATLDIMNRKRIEEELREGNRELAAFAQVASHDLKGPLSSILAGARLLEDLIDDPGNNDADLREVVRMMASNSRKAYEITGEILELAKSGQVPSDVTDVDVKEVVDRVLDERKAEIEHRDIQVIIEGRLGVVRGNGAQIYQLFSNLVGNAIKFNCSEKPVVEIIECDGGDDGMHEYVIRDNGPGIPEDFMDEALLPFKRGQGGGTGIGLSIAEKIVKAYGGEISVFNNGGANLKFNLNDLSEEPTSSGDSH